MMERSGWRRFPAFLALVVFGLLQPTFVCGLDCVVHRVSGTPMSAQAQHALVAPCHGASLTRNQHPPLSPTGVAPLPPELSTLGVPVVRFRRTVLPTRQLLPHFGEQDPPPPRA